MKTFEELKQTRLSNEERKLAIAKKGRENYDNNTYDQNFAYFEQIKNSQKVIENLDEAVRIEIAIYANLLHNELRNTSDLYTFYSVFQKYISEAETIFTDGNIYANHPELPPLYNLMITKAIIYFGFTQNDLQRLIDNNINIISKDVFLSFINNSYNTNIPLSTEWKEYFEHPMPEYEIERIEEKCRYSLLKLRNGELVYKGNYPLEYEADILGYFDAYPEIIKSAYIKKLTPPENTENK